MKRRLFFLAILTCFVCSLMSFGTVNADWYKRGERQYGDDEQVSDSARESDENVPPLEENQEYLPAEEENNVPEVNQEDSSEQESEPVQQEEGYREEIQNQETENQ